MATLNDSQTTQSQQVHTVAVIGAGVSGIELFSWYAALYGWHTFVLPSTNFALRGITETLCRGARAIEVTPEVSAEAVA